MNPIFQFSNVVVVGEGQIGVILKTWQHPKEGYNYDVYVRSSNSITNYKESKIKHFIYSKYLAEDELEFYH